MLASSSLLAPLRQLLFRRIWTASLFSNFGLLIGGVGSAWAMTQMTGDPLMIALVQSAIMLPTMLLSLVAGALADMYDRRKVALSALSLSFVGATALSLVRHLDLLSPSTLLLFCFTIGAGQALFGPAWQASVIEQVPLGALATAVRLNSVSYNIARSFGPAIGGMIVAVGGSTAAFIINASFYLPLLVVLALWRRVRDVPRLPPEELSAAVRSGVRYVVHSPPMRAVLVRTFTVGVAGGVVLALLPLVAREILQGDARTYGFSLGMFGLGSVLGALGISAGRGGKTSEARVRLNTLVMAAAIIVIGLSKLFVVTALALVVAGTSWLALANNFNVSVQMSAPRWVAGRALATYQAAISGGVAIGSYIWGLLASESGVRLAILCAAAALAALPLLARWAAMPEVKPEDREMTAARDEPRAALALIGRSGPIIITVEYRIDPDEAREFYTAMQDLRHSRQRNGARDWSISRDIDDPRLWTERFQCATWHDFLRMRDRLTLVEQKQQALVTGFHRGDEPMRTKRMLGRPFGSVRWMADAPDAGTDLTPNMAGPA